VFKTLDVPKATFTEPHGINNKGKIVGTYVDKAGKFHGFVYDKGKFTTIDVPSKATALFTQARGITNDGRIVGYYVADGRYHGFVYYKKGKFTTIDVPDATHTYVHHINASGQIVGAYRDQNNRTHGFVATP
jgi:probable HAF family extracellular repeat protein